MHLGAEGGQGRTAGEVLWSALAVLLMTGVALAAVLLAWME